MANRKNKINELVCREQDPTEEFESLSPGETVSTTDVHLESLADTCGIGSAVERKESRASVPNLEVILDDRTEAVNRLRYDVEHLRVKRLGLEAELSARTDIVENLNLIISDLQKSSSRKEKLLNKRDRIIDSLKTEIRDRSAIQAHQIDLLMRDRSALERLLHDDAARQHLVPMAELAGQLASSEVLVTELQDKFERAERYADSLRRQHQDREVAIDEAESAKDFVQQSFDRLRQQHEELRAEFESGSALIASLEQELVCLHEKHADEIRLIRFELGEAQETVAQQEVLSQQLASDLVETRGFRIELESMLSDSEEHSKSQIDKLELESRKLRREARQLRQKLEAKNEAINYFLAGLANKPVETESDEEIEDAIQKIDDRMSEHMVEHSHVGKDRITRVLIGSVDGQELRFPLFKDRLTIGRTDQNDIQLKVDYISRRHAVVVTEDDNTRIIDWGSKNGVFVNATRISEHFLKNGDIVGVGVAEFRYEERRKRDS